MAARKNDDAPTRVLVVDDDEGIRVLLASVLAAPGRTVASAATGAEALRLARADEYDAILLDRVLPDVDAVQIVTALRAAAPSAAIVMLSAVDDVEARVAGLRLGADDFLTKPFHVSEVLARIDAVRRRGTPAGDPDVLRYADLELDLAGQRVRRGGEIVPLTPTELRLLRFLLENAERVLSRGQLLDHVWRYDFGGSGEVVEKAVSTLRRKVDAGRQPLIQTVRGFGYCLRVEP
ncbi:MULTISPECIES: response regulator transcription factor [Microbacterium]|jgi:two-component system OmpR family response regulator|uniref:Response regulator transcription factor n=1 Tax=Microbacterium mcarthurae TaxID=3035918 RepID=A0ABW9GKB9_9MICO|nr:response regulator transcription factor [Microbacterium sp. ACRRU]MCG7417060.1 response regulator transcription factor [Microbacterium sp. ACRRU]